MFGGGGAARVVCCDEREVGRFVGADVEVSCECVSRGRMPRTVSSGRRDNKRKRPERTRMNQ